MRWILVCLMVWASSLTAQVSLDSVWVATQPNYYTTAAVDTQVTPIYEFANIDSMVIDTVRVSDPGSVLFYFRPDTSYITIRVDSTITGYDSVPFRNFEKLKRDTVESIVYVFATKPELVTDTTITEERVDALGLTNDNISFEHFYTGKVLEDFDPKTETRSMVNKRIPAWRIDKCTLWKYKGELPARRLFNAPFDGAGFGE